MTAPMLTSMVCRRAHWDTDWYRRWDPIFTGSSPTGEHFVPPRVVYHRKVWEWAAIAQALEERGMLAPGTRGCGFAVGREPLASLFAAKGLEILATDLGADDTVAKTWSSAGQHAANLDALYWEKIVDRPTFDARVRFMPQDMRALRPAELGTHDFIWSACSFEHLGSLEAGLDFVLRSTELLRPGGIAVHTTEINLSDTEDTVFTGDSVIYRRRDFDTLAARLRRIGCGMERLDDFAGTDPEDIEYDYEPYYQHGRAHIKLMLGGFVTTSCLIIVTKGRYPGPLPPLAGLNWHRPAIWAQPGGPSASAFERLRGTALWRALGPLRAVVRRARGL